jgi:hypothetical protein
MPNVKLSEKVYRKLLKLQEEIVHVDLEDEGDSVEREVRKFWDLDNLIDFMIGDMRETSERMEKRYRGSKFQKAHK